MHYKINKIGLLNFWLYDEEEFLFSDGKLILRGTNGSGKSVTMQSFIPLLFDGNKSPKRLDPFGGKDRKIEDYILGDGINDNTSYLYIELKLEDKYKTIGIGMRAKRGINVDFWGFCIKDGKRIRKDIFLYKDIYNKIPLTKLELKNRLMPDNIYVDNVKEYKEMVNREIFGFNNMEAYDEFLNLIIKTRSPKLSNAFKPSLLTVELSNVLQPLNDEEIRPMSEALEVMDKTKEKLAHLETTEKNIRSLLKSYQDYNQATLVDRAKTFLNTKSELDNFNKTISDLKNSLSNLENDIISSDSTIKDIEQEILKYQNKKSLLDKEDISSLINESDTIKELINTLNSKLTIKEDDADQKQSLLIEEKNRLKKYEDELYQFEKQINESFNDLRELFKECGFNEGIIFFDAIDSLKNFNLKSLNQALELYKNKLENLKIILNEINALEKQYQFLDVDYINSKKELDDKILSVEKIKQEVSDEIDNYKNELTNYFNSCDILKLDDINKKQIFEFLNDIEPNYYSKIIELIRNEVDNAKDSINEEINYQNSEIKHLNTIIEDTNKQIYELENSTDLDYVQEDIITDSRKILDSENIPYLPFYKAVEFKTENQAISNKLEAALIDMGIINSLLVPKEYQSKINSLIEKGVKDSFLIARTNVSNNLTSYFSPVKNDIISGAEIIDILSSIGTENGSIAILANGIYQNNLIYGLTNQKYKAKYIGILLREKERQRQLEELSITLSNLNSEKRVIVDKKTKLTENLELLILEFKGIPESLTITENLNKQTNIIKEIEIKEKNINELYNKISSLKSTIAEYNLKVLKENENLLIKISYDNIDVILKSLNDSKIDLNNLDNILSSSDKCMEQKYLTDTRLESINDDIDKIRLELSDIDKEITLNTNKLNNISEKINSKDNQDLINQLNECNQKLISLPKMLETLKENYYRNIERKKILENDINEKLGQLSSKEQILNIYYNGFLNEYNLKYVYADEITNVISSAKDVVSNLKSLLDKPHYKYDEKLNEEFIKANMFLVDYLPRNESINEVNEDAENSEILEKLIRRDITCTLKGKKVGLLILQKDIISNIEDLKHIIDEEDRTLFKDVLIGNIGRVIKEKIVASDEWIKKIKKLMEDMNTSSGLSFSLEWRQRKAETEDEMDTKAIVDILYRDINIVDPEDLNKLIRHFKSKIKRAEELAKEKDVSFYSIMEHVLDYRDWFEFKLYYKRNNVDRKELSDSEFSRFSGGEKALAMYVPLFASIYAKMNSAKTTALRLVALDEAFAGVDDQNIRDAFRIISELDLDYVMTSQILWGDFDTNKNVAISELHRPQNSDTVSILRYKWNGNKRILMTNGDEDYA